MTESPSPEAALAHARHELRTPLGAMLGYSEMILEDDLGLAPEHVRELQSFHEQSRALLDLVPELLSAGQLHAQGGELTALGASARARFLPIAEQLIQVSDQLRTTVGQTEATQDLERIGVASRLFRDMLDRELSFASAGAAPAVPLRPPTRSAVPTESAQPARQDTEPADTSFDAFSGNVLVVDDMAFNREILARGLWRQKRHFALARNGKEALEMLDEGGFDLVLLDLMMPEMDGFEVLARLKADARTSHIPVIMISALDQMDGIVRCIQMGAEDYLPKPFDPVLLEARVSACLEKKRLRDLELEYLRNVTYVTQAAEAVETGNFDPVQIEDVASRTDSLGRLARVFQKMAREVRAREDRLKMEVQQLKVEIDEVRKAKQVEEITESDYFQQLQERAETLRRRPKK